MDALFQTASKCKNRRVSPPETKGASIMKITTAGIDLAKNVFQVHGVDAQGKVVLRKKLDRSKMVEYFVKLAPCLIGMEACGSAHYWARKLTVMGHTVKLMAPQFVKPYVKTNKNDAADADLVVKARQTPLVLGHELRLKAAVAVARDVEFKFGFGGQHRLLAAAVTVITRRLWSIALLLEVVRELGLKHSFCKRFFQLAEQPGVGEHGLRVARVYTFKQFV